MGRGGGVLSNHSNHDLTKMHKHEVTIMYVKQYQHAFLLLVNIFKRWDIVRGETLSSQPGEWPYSINSISVYAVLLTFQWKYRSTKIINFTVLYSDLKNQFMHRVKLPVFWFFFQTFFFRLALNLLCQYLAGCICPGIECVHASIMFWCNA